MPQIRLVPCSHGLSDMVVITDKTVIEDYQHGTRKTIYGYQCQEHERAGCYSITNKLFMDKEVKA